MMSAYSRNLAGFLALVAVFVWLAMEPIRSNFIMLDEFGHIPAGMSYWQTGRFELYHENPPLVQCLSGLPPLLAKAKVDYSKVSRGRSEWAVGAEFIRQNTPRLHGLVIGSRCVILMLGVACAALIYWWSRRNYGPTAALVCSSLWLLDPTVVAFSGVVTADVGAAFFGLLATFVFWRYAEKPGRRNLILAGIGLGLALGTKFNMMTLFVAWTAAYALRRNAVDVAPGPWQWRATGLVAIGLIALFMLNSLYTFEGTFTPLGAFEFKSRALAGLTTADVKFPPEGNRFRGTILETLPTPLPRHYVLGLDSQKWEEETGLRNLVDGRLVRGGHWYRPLLTLGRKLPLGTMALIVGALGYWLFLDRKFRFQELVLWLPAAVLLATLCLHTGLNWAVRYSIPALPFLFIAAGPFFSYAWKCRALRYFVLACVAWNAIELSASRPHYFSHANAIVGISNGGQRVFHGSNYDWGQDLIRFRNWYDLYPDMRPMALSYYGVVEPNFVGVPSFELPEQFLKGGKLEKSAARSRSESFYWAISSNLLNRMTGRFSLSDGSNIGGFIDSGLLRPENAVARIGSTISVFHIRADGVDGQGVALRDLAGCLRTYEPDGRLDASP